MDLRDYIEYQKLAELLPTGCGLMRGADGKYTIVLPPMTKDGTQVMAKLLRAMAFQDDFKKA